MKLFLKHLVVITCLFGVAACEPIHKASTSWESIWYDMHTKDPDTNDDYMDTVNENDEYVTQSSRQAEEGPMHKDKTSVKAHDNAIQTDYAQHQDFNSEDDYSYMTDDAEMYEEQMVVDVHQGAVMCPHYDNVKDLSELHQFYDPQNPAPGQRVAQIKLSGMAMTCKMHGQDMIMDIDVTFDALLGPRSRIFEGDQPNISYPYFIAVTNKQGKILNKVIHGVSMAFGPMEVSKTHHEKVKEIFTVEYGMDVTDLMVLVGFQLTEQELAYNRSMKEQSENRPISIIPSENAGISRN